MPDPEMPSEDRTHQYLSMYHVGVVPTETRRGHQIPGNWNYRWLRAARRGGVGDGTKPGFPARAAGASND